MLHRLPHFADVLSREDSIRCMLVRSGTSRLLLLDGRCGRVSSQEAAPFVEVRNGSGCIPRACRSRNGDVSARSRQVLKASRTDVCANLFGYALQASVFSKVPVDLAVPRSTVPLANKGSQLCELFGRKGIHGALNFCETHGARITVITSRNNYRALRNSVGVTPATRRKSCAKAFGLV
jgi:hypothetical protein